MSTLFSYGNFAPGFGRSAEAAGHQSHSWSGLLEKWRVWEERAHQRAALRDIADDPHLLSDLGLTRDEAMMQANKSFWR
jgi:uncharacterized protein YjiS (DUF1127 family)